jgi:hypothetical protein
MRENLLHVYAQAELNDPVVIVGDRTALEGLKEEVDRTVRGQDGVFFSLVADDEGFSTVLMLVRDGDPFPLRDRSSIFEGCERPTRTNILWVYGQESWHDDSVVVGDRRALEQLNHALGEALREGEATFSSCASDDRGFEVLVKLAEDAELLRALPLPYRADFAGGRGDRSRQVALLLRKGS